jgi:hypothetical protein
MGDEMSDIARFQMSGVAYMTPFMNGEWVRYHDHLAYVERLREDAERYRWLRSSQTHKSIGCVESGTWRALLNGPELDAAVDRGRLTAAKAGGRDE